MITPPSYTDYDTFILIKELPDNSVPLGTKGVILMVHGGEPAAYEIEFPSENGGNIGLLMTYTLTEEYFRKENT